MKDTGGVGKDGGQTLRRKPGRVATSCAECRRLKLRCDKNVPCEKCVSRGCGVICPEGSLAPGKGSRLILANTGELHDRIDQQCARIRDLEDALRNLQASVSPKPHPLLEIQQSSPPNHSSWTPSSDRVARTSATLSSSKPSTPSPISLQQSDSNSHNMAEPEETSSVDALGTLTMGLHGESSFFGRTARPEFLIRSSRPLERVAGPRFFSEVGSDLRREILGMMPSLPVAQQLCRVYQEYGKYLYTPLHQTELDEILLPVYEGSLEASPVWHSIGLLLVVFALGAFFDSSRRPYSAEAEEYYGRACNALERDTQTSRRLIQALIHTAQYLDFSDPNSMRADTTWNHIAYAVRSGQSIGIHLNCARWSLPENSQCRSDLFWQLFHLDTWGGFHTGRPPMMSATEIDWPMQADEDHPRTDEGMSFHRWNWKYATLLRTIMDTAFGPKPMSYDTVLSLDSQVRDFPVPDRWLASLDIWDSSNSGFGQSRPTRSCELYLRRWVVLSSKEITLLNLHRAYCARALEEMPADPARHRFVASVVAMYRSAWQIIDAIRIMWAEAPRLFERANLPWSYALSAGIAMCLLVTRCPTSSLSNSALAELTVLVKLFQDAAPSCRSAESLLGPILNLHQKAHDVITRGPVPSVLSDTELDRLSGKTHLLVEKGAPESVGRTARLTDLHSTSRIPPAEGAYFSHPSVESNKNIHPSLAEHVEIFKAGGRTMVDDRSPFYGGPQAHHHDCHGQNHGHHHPNYQRSNFGLQTHAGSRLDAGMDGGCGYSTYGHQPQHRPQHHAPSLPFEQSSLMLDVSWQPFVEQLGFGVPL